eukprot:Gregarina_sp_Pseudo_9__3846@NODE_399_length_2923_cov_12_300624_g376_i0_p1_GENE_NODE_399_length_2923_cov_12_300624_g376_i0NODE_399_length_2923_cov_12_300624_g376_i0_p1_ORF_typecomplete_len928_score216_99BTB/PF00651_31/2_3e12_NODE_399_length_2923_cov_12_300624_g376_i0672850
MSHSESSRSDVLTESREGSGLAACFKDASPRRSDRTAAFADRFTTDLYLSPPDLGERLDGSPWNRSPVHNRFDITKKQQITVATPPTRYVATPTSAAHSPTQKAKSPEPSEAVRPNSKEKAKESGSGPFSPSSGPSSPSSSYAFGSHGSKGKQLDESKIDIHETESVERERLSPRLSQKSLYFHESPGAGTRKSVGGSSLAAKEPEQKSPRRDNARGGGWFCSSPAGPTESSERMVDGSSDGGEHSPSPQYEETSPAEAAASRSRWCPAIPKRSPAQQSHRPASRRLSEAVAPMTRQTVPSKPTSASSAPGSKPGLPDYHVGPPPPEPRRSFRIFRSCREPRSSGAALIADSASSLGAETETRAAGETAGTAASVMVSSSEAGASPRGSPSENVAFEDGPSPNMCARTGMLRMCCLGGQASEKTDKYKLSLPAETASPRPAGGSVRIELNDDLITYRDLQKMEESKTVKYVGALDLGDGDSGATGATASPSPVAKHAEALRAASAVGFALESSKVERQFGAYTPVRSECYLGFVSSATMHAQVLDAASRAAKQEYQPGGGSNPPSRRIVTWSSPKYAARNSIGDTLGLVFELSLDGLLRSSLLLPTSDPKMQNAHFDVHLTLTASPPPGGTYPVVFTDKYVTLPGSVAVPVKIEESFGIQPDDLSERLSADTQLLIMINVVQLGTHGGLCKEVAALYRSPEFNQPPAPIADVTVVCERQVCPALRGVLMARSSVFREMLSGKSRAVIAVTGASPAIVKNLIDYCHTDTCDKLEGKDDDLQSVIKLFETSVRFGVEALANELAVRFLSRLSPETASAILNSAQKTSHVHLTESLQRYQTSFSSSPLKPVERFTAASVELASPLESPPTTAQHTSDHSSSARPLRASSRRTSASSSSSKQPQTRRAVFTSSSSSSSSASSRSQPLKQQL